MAQTLGSVAVGSIVKINESGSPVDFYVACHNYEQALNGAGRTLLVRKDSVGAQRWAGSSINAYASSAVDSWENSTYKGKLDPDIQTAIGTTKFRYTPGNGDTSLSTLGRSVFTPSARELGITGNYYNAEGSELAVASLIRDAFTRAGQAGWTRTPSIANTYGAISITASPLAALTTDVTASQQLVVQFTLPSTMIVMDDGAIVSAPPAPSMLTVPVQAMQGNQITVSWSAVDGADGYILERKADTDADWTQVYSGANTSFEESVGTWTSVQYRVKAGVSGTYGDYTTSASVPVVSASAVVISGSDGNLGTLVNDVSYTVSSNGTNPLTVTEIINGTTTRTFTATNGATIRIPVMDLPTGTGTIKITASTNPGSGVVTVTRNWTYSKTAPTFANAGSTAQLQQNGKNVFPLTLLECVRGGENLAPGGYGLGTPAQLRASANDCKLSGWYMTAFNVPNAPDGDGGYWLIRVDGRDDTVLYQTAYANRQNSGVPNSVICRRYYVNSEWSPWEYITPPMQLGVEYRTVERYNSKPVYVKAVNCGTLPDGSTKYVSHGVTNIDICFEVSGSLGKSNLVLQEKILDVYVEGDSIRIYGGSNVSTRGDAIVLMKYTKTTD